MGLSRVFVGFSSEDINYYRLMQAWKKNDNFDFDFADCQLHNEINSTDEKYIKSKCRSRIDLAGTYVMLIGKNTKHKHKYVRWEAEVAIEQNCRIIAVNIDKSRHINSNTCPSIIQGIGAIFVPFSPTIVNYAINNYKMNNNGNYSYKESLYKELGY